MLTTRELYGLRALLDIAEHDSVEPVQAHAIARRQGIPEPYLTQVLLTLKRGGVVRSQRGAGGGYRLARPAHEITLDEVLVALGTAFLAAEERPGAYDAAWELEIRLLLRVREVLESMTLQSLLERERALRTDQHIAAGI